MNWDAPPTVGKLLELVLTGKDAEGKGLVLPGAGGARRLGGNIPGRPGGVAPG